MAQWLGVELETLDISPVMQEKKVYAPLIMKLIPYSPRFNRMIQYAYRLINRESPIKTTLKMGAQASGISWLKRFMFNIVNGTSTVGFQNAIFTAERY